MKKLLLIIIAIIIPIGVIIAQETTKLHLSFSKEQFSFTFDSNHSLQISSNDVDVLSVYGGNTSEPCLPLVSIEIQVPQGTTFDGLTHTSSKKLIFEDVSVAANPNVIPTSSQAIRVAEPYVKYSMPSYPINQIKNITTSTLDGKTTLHLQVCPFEYDALNRNLYILENIDITIKMRTDVAMYTDNRESFAKFCDKNNINFYEPVSEYSAAKNLSGIGDSIDYLIITSKEFSYYFQPLAQWKITKGVRTKITTIEDIQNMDKESGRSLPDMIKAYLLYMYHMKGYHFKYLLLGGDDSVVPSKKCYGVVKDYINNEILQEDMIPTDLFYACLDYTKDPFWDSSRNGICGELSDSVSFSQNLFVTRLPLSTTTDVKTTLMKILEYEKNPSPIGWNNSILMAGCKLEKYNTNDGHSDAEYSGDILYRNSIQKYWDGKRVKLYDTYSDLVSEGMDSLTTSNLTKSLNKGYAFIDMMTHGNFTWWNTPNYDCYDNIMASTMASRQYSVITTIACRTNGFDMAEPCLSEAFIRNPNNGVIAYLGSSRAGWIYKNGFYSSGPSAQYEEFFYKYLFSDELKDKNFGKIVAYTKNSKLAGCNSYGCDRWLLYSLNPIGDTEMPIFTTTPKTFSGSDIMQTHGKTVIRTGTDDCKVCVMSSNDFGKTYYKVYNNAENIIFNNISKDLTVCITKQNYIPKVYELKAASVSDKNAIITEMKQRGNHLVVETRLGDDVKDAILNVSSSEGNKVDTHNVSYNSSVQVDTSSMKSGIYVVSLVVNGTVVDSKQIIIK